MKKFLTAFFALCLVLSNLTGPVFADTTTFSVPAKAAIAVDSQSGKILYAQNATKAMGLASITKILTAYLVLEQIHDKKMSWNTEIPVSNYAFSLTQDPDASNIMVASDGAKFSARDLFNALLVQSANSAAIAFAQKIAGSEPKFVDMMRAQVKKWGITDAHLVNASGLNNSMLGSNIYPGSSADDENQLSASDIAIIADHLITDFPEVLQTTKQTSVLFDKNGPSEQALHTYNYMLEGYQDYRTGVDGLKTGTTALAGACFVATTVQNGFRIITVVLNADNADGNEYARFDATNALMNHVYGTWTTTDYANKNQSLDQLSKMTVIDGKKKSVKLIANEDFDPVIPSGSDSDQAISVKFDRKSNSTVEAPVKKGQKLVTATVKISDKLGYLPGFGGHSFDLVAQNDVARANPLAVFWNHFVKFVNEKL